EVRSALPSPGFVVVPVEGGYSTEEAPRRAACTGRVRIDLFRGRQRLETATVRVDRNCKYAKTFRLREARVGDATHLDVVARFLGNAVLDATTFPRRRVPVVRAAATANRGSNCPHADPCADSLPH